MNKSYRLFEGTIGGQSEPSKAEDTLDFLKRTGKIFEPIKERYKCSI